jgi:hypothetical protein
MGLGGSEQCGCVYCRNFVAARAAAYPSSVLTLFQQLGIDPWLEAETYELGRAEPIGVSEPLYRYGGWFHVVGTLVEHGEHGEYVDGYFRMVALPGGAVVPDSFKSSPLFRLDFTTRIPWLLEERYPG